MRPTEAYFAAVVADLKRPDSARATVSSIRRPPLMAQHSGLPARNCAFNRLSSRRTAMRAHARSLFVASMPSSLFFCPERVIANRSEDRFFFRSAS